jgi:hypothetical protein
MRRNTKDTTMTNRIKLSSKFLTVNGKRAGITISAGPWVAGVPAELIKVRCKRGVFPAGFREALEIENNSDSMTDYFESDCIRLMPGHALYDAAKAAA